MALARYVLTADVTVPAGTFTLDASTGLRFGTGSYAGAANVYPGPGPVKFFKGQAIMLDSAGSVYAAIGAATCAT